MTTFRRDDLPRSSTPAALAIVVAMAKNRCIGKDNGLPWHLPEDLRHFRKITMGHAIIMGRRTHESIGRALPGRHNIVLTTSPAVFEGCDTAATLTEAVQLASARGDHAPRVIGGARVFEEALPLSSTLYLTEVHQPVSGDTFFPSFDRGDWEETRRTPSCDGSCTFVTLDRRRPAHPGS